MAFFRFRQHVAALRLLSAVIALSASSAAISQPVSAADQMKFFGFAVGQVSPRWNLRGDSSYSIGTTQFWTDNFTVSADQSPAWLSEPLKVQLGSSRDGVVQEARFVVNNLKNESEHTDPKVRAKRFNELVDMVSQKMGAKPDGRETAPWTLRWPIGRVAPIATEVATWKRPWGDVYVMSCTYQSYPYYKCFPDDFAPVILVRTKMLVDFLESTNERQKQRQIETDRSRLKM